MDGIEDRELSENPSPSGLNEGAKRMINSDKEESKYNALLKREEKKKARNDVQDAISFDKIQDFNDHNLERFEDNFVQEFQENKYLAEHNEELSLNSFQDNKRTFLNVERSKSVPSLGVNVALKFDGKKETNVLNENFCLPNKIEERELNSGQEEIKSMNSKELLDIEEPKLEKEESNEVVDFKSAKDSSFEKVTVNNKTTTQKENAVENILYSEEDQNNMKFLTQDKRNLTEEVVDFVPLNNIQE